MRKVGKVEPLSKIGNPKPNNQNNFSNNQNDSDKKEFSNLLKEHVQKKQENLIQKEEPKKLVLTRQFVSSSISKVNTLER